MQIGAQTDRGKNRDHNEDALLALEAESVFLVADGVGGHRAGEVASGTAAALLRQRLAARPLKGETDEDAVREYFLEYLQEANGTIEALARQNPENAGMATTAVLLYVGGSRAFVANVGDSRAYLLRDGVLRQITEDHTFVNQLLKEGTITDREACNHPSRNMITRALGGEETVAPDFYLFPVFEGDVLLLCSDGLYNEVEEEAIGRHAEEASDMQSLADRLVALANENGGGDNITVVCVRIGIEEEEV
ncbi:MAG: Stp1/IreP family PP2C-type Ser/Thr phosphatase [Bacillota bacterium]|nr:Stp1/IreP family PP2C-type Ser/Thr phosphatase [Bacillota bacterium]